MEHRDIEFKESDDVNGGEISIQEKDIMAVEIWLEDKHCKIISVGQSSGDLKKSTSHILVKYEKEYIDYKFGDYPGWYIWSQSTQKDIMYVCLVRFEAIGMC